MDYIKINKFIHYYPKFVLDLPSVYNTVHNEVIKCLEQHTIIVWGKNVLEPRLGAFFSVGGVKGYRYSKSERPTFDIRKYPYLFGLMNRCSKTLEVKFNSCLVNFYRTGKDYIGEHSDDERDLKKSDIASISLGAERDFVIRDKKNTKNRVVVLLEHGSLVHMFGQCQQLYKHGVPKRMKITEGRINITFRVV